jgi:hypothetical protein
MTHPPLTQSQTPTAKGLPPAAPEPSTAAEGKTTKAVKPPGTTTVKDTPPATDTTRTTT